MYNKRTYILTNLDTGAEITLDGDGRNVEPDVATSDKTWKRSVKDFAFTFTFSKDYRFFQNAATFLTNAYNNRDIQANVEFKEVRYDSKTDAPYNYIIGMFDFSDYLADKDNVSIPVKSGGLKAIIKSKRSKKVELDTLESLNGKVIDPLITQEFAVANRSLPLASKLETSEDNSSSNETGFKIQSFQSGLSIPMSVISESDDSFVPPQPNIYIDTEDEITYAALFYDTSDVNKSIDLNISGSLTLWFLAKSFEYISYTAVYLYVYDALGDEKNRIKISNDYSSIYEGEYNFDVLFNSSISLLQNESIAMIVYVETSYPLRLFQKNIKVKLESFELSTRNDIPRRSKCVLNKDAGEKLAQIMTGEKNRYYSEYYNNGEFKLLASTTGKWIRGFLDSTYTTSFKDFIENSKSVLNMAYNIEIINGVETIVHEPLKYFFQQGVAFELPNQVSGVKRSVAKEFVFSSISSGYKKPSGDNLYEEVSGLSEVSTSNEYIAPIDKITNDYGIESPYRADSEGKELTVRQSILKFPTTDYRADKNIFNLDLKDEGTTVYSERTWQDDYEIAPYSNDTNNPVFEPNTLTGMRLTPYRNMARHFWFLNNAYTKEANKYIRYASTRGNADFVTKKVGKDPVSENGKYLIADIEPPLFVSKWIKFKHIVTDDIVKLLEGKTNVNGRDIPNLYFKIGFINEFGNKEYGYLFELKPDKAGEWKLLKAL